jgi:hypothetical protein
MSLRHAVPLLLALSMATAAQELPSKGDAKDPERAAAELFDALPDLSKLEDRAAPLPAPTLSVAKAEARLAAATRKAERWEKLARQGVVSRVEAETAMMDRYLAALFCEQARLAEARAAQAATPEGAALVEAAQERVAAAEEEWHRAKLETTRRNLARIKTLYAERLVTKAHVQRIEALLASLEKASAERRPTSPTAPASPVPSAAPAPPLPAGR